MLEGSNVDMAEEMSEMIVTQRAFQLSSKGITTADEAVADDKQHEKIGTGVKF